MAVMFSAEPGPGSVSALACYCWSWLLQYGGFEEWQPPYLPDAGEHARVKKKKKEKK